VYIGAPLAAEVDVTPAAAAAAAWADSMLLQRSRSRYSARVYMMSINHAMEVRPNTPSRPRGPSPMTVSSSAAAISVRRVHHEAGEH